MEIQRKGSKKKKMIFLFASIGLGFLFTGGYYLNHSSSFSLDKIRPSTSFAFQTVKSDSEEDIEQFHQITSKPFHFLVEGNETYVFVSEDDKYVLRFFKVRRFTPKYWLNYIPVPWLDKKRLSKVSDRAQARHDTFSSLKIAFEQFKYQTGLVFLHLFHTDYLKKKVVLLDKNGKTHKIRLDDVPFILQKKVTMINDYISNLVSLGQEDEAVHALGRILRLVKEGCQRGFSGYRELVDEDYGFIEGRPVYIGLGNFVKDETFKTARSTLKEVFRMSNTLSSWLEEKYPSLLPKFQDEVQDLLYFLEGE